MNLAPSPHFLMTLCSCICSTHIGGSQNSLLFLRVSSYPRNSSWPSCYHGTPASLHPYTLLGLGEGPRARSQVMLKQSRASLATRYLSGLLTSDQPGALGVGLYVTVTVSGIAGLVLGPPPPWSLSCVCSQISQIAFTGSPYLCCSPDYSVLSLKLVIFWNSVLPRTKFIF